MARHLLLLTAGLLASASSAAAQYPYPYQPQAYGTPPGGMAGPPLSPYLNLLNGPGNAGVNYYNFVRPQLQLQQQQMYYGGGGGGGPVDYNLASSLPTSDWTARIPRPTGVMNSTPAAFMNYGTYFDSMGTIGTANQQAAAGRASQPAVPSVPRR